MLDELRIWLEQIVPLEQVDLYVTAFEDLRDINDLSAETEFCLLWQEKDRIYGGELLDSLRAILNTGARKALRSHGIFFTEETNISLLTKALEGIIWLNNTEDSDEVVKIFSGDYTDKDKLAILFQYVNNDSLEIWQDSITDVSQLFIARVLEDHSETRIIHEEFSNYDLSALTRYEVKFQNRLYRKAVELGANPGVIDVVTLLEMFREQLSQWYPFSPREAAIDIAGLVLFSDLEQKNLSKQAGLLAERFYTDAGFMQALNAQLGQVFGEIQIYG